MVKPVLIAITGTQQLAGEKPESIQLVTEGSYCCEPGFIRFSYVERRDDRHGGRCHVVHG